MEDSETVVEPRVKRQKTDRHGKSAAFERLKQLKGKGIKHKYEVSDIDNVYETVDEKEYSKKVYERQDDDWIVDDDGSGYVEDGRDIFDDDLDSESIANASKSKDVRKKKKNVSKSAVKGNIQAMLSSMPEKKQESVNLDQDDILLDVLSGLDDSVASSSSMREKPSISFEYLEKKTAKDYMNSFSMPKPVKVKLKSRTSIPKPRVLKEIPVEDNYIHDEDFNLDSKDEFDEPMSSDVSEDIENIPKSVNKNEKVSAKEETVDIKEEICGSSFFDDDFDLTDVQGIDDSEKSAASKSSEEITEENLISGWETMQDGVSNRVEPEIILDSSQLPLLSNSDGEQVFRFYWYDAYEDMYKQPGVVFLFGKTYVKAAKSYASCCVVVRNIDRKIYLLPRPYHFDDDLRMETDTPVKMIDVYHEFNNVFSDKLKIEQFRSRKVTRKYAFDPEIPTQSEYLEIRYAAKNPAMDRNAKGKTFSNVFGVHTNFLEILLLERKIKGPCWLEFKSPQPVTNPLSWCKFEVNCTTPSDLIVVPDQHNMPPPPLVVATLNIRTIPNKNMINEIVMIGCLVHNKYCIDKQPPNPPFQQHFCVFTKPSHLNLPLNFHEALKSYKSTQVQKCDSERALLNYFLGRFAKIDPDLVVGHDLVDYHISMMCGRLDRTKATKWSRFGRLKRSNIPTKPRFQKDLMVGRLVCDLKISSKELIKSRSYDLDTLCHTVLKLKDRERPELESGDVLKMFGTSETILNLVSLTMQDAAYITKMMYELNVMPLALQITTIAGNVMSKTLLGGRAERNEFLLLHAFTEKDYIVPDKNYSSNNKKMNFDDIVTQATQAQTQDTQTQTQSVRKKPTYAGGLVLDPKVGFYDKLILLMDFNSLYPSIIQEYNICFTTIPGNADVENVLSNSADPGILPTQIRRLVESRRQVKQLMSSSDISNDLRMQYNIRQLALKLTANSMYGCLGFSNSRFFAKHLASLVTMKGRDILLHTRDLVQSMGFEVIYGDTDSIMINTNIQDYDQVFKIGSSIKQAVNKFYRQIELDVDGVFRYMLLLKKKKYAAVTMSKNKNGELILQQEHKGLDIIRRDWSLLASEVGKMVLNHILSEQSADERIENIQSVLNKIASDLAAGNVPLQLLLITKQLTKDPKMYTDKTALSHVQVALRFNQKGGKPLTAGDVVPYVICEDGTQNSATQRAYHVEEFKNSKELKIDTKYYLSQQIHPVVSRLCEPIDGLDAYQIANYLGIDTTSFKPSKPKSEMERTERTAVNKFQNAEAFEFLCKGCKELNSVTSDCSNGKFWLEKCSNPECSLPPVEYLYYVQNQLVQRIKTFIKRYYDAVMICEDPLCTNETNLLPQRFAGKYPVCTMCMKGVMYRKYTEGDLYKQLCFYKHLFDLSKIDRRPLDPNVAQGYKLLKENVEYFLNKSAYSVIDIASLFQEFNVADRVIAKSNIFEEFVYEEDEDEF